MKIVSMDQSHIEQIANLEQRCFSDPWSARSIESELSNRLSLWLVALDGDTVAGYIGSQTVLGEADMMNIAVSPEYRRQGVARSLVEALEQRLRAKDTYQLTLEVRVSNAPAIALYEKLGFRQIGKRPNYYSHPKEDAYILRKEWQL